LITRRDNSIEAISPEGMPLGILPDVAFEHVVVPFADCTSAVLYTDGLTEARNAHGEFFGQERLLELVRKSLRHPSESLLHNMLTEAQRFSGTTEFDDDVCLVCMDVARTG
jgi:serine phosphatase RsbU (regulator of sigma subunit)